ncbi:MAG: type II toxin-antitoxin system VapC family toxin [Dehalococcoidia bacterium]
MPYLLDSDWVIQALGGRSPAVTELRRLVPAQVSISLVTIGEVYEGAFDSPNPRAHLRAFGRFWQYYRVLTLTDPIMEQFAKLRALLRRRGEIIPDFDLLLAATALQYDLTMLTFNLRHFQRIPDLKLYRPG